MVNGVNLMDLQKMRKTRQLSTPGRSKKTTQEKRRSEVSTTPSSGNILKYLEKKPAQVVRKKELHIISLQLTKLLRGCPSKKTKITMYYKLFPSN